MTDVQILAYVVLPICIVIGSWVVAFAVNPPRWLVSRVGAKANAKRVSHF